MGAHTLPTTSLTPGDSFVGTFYLQSVRPINRNLNVLVRVVDENNEELLRDEGWPQGKPTSTWPVGEVWADGHEFTIPTDAGAGYYRVELSFYGPTILDTIGEAVTVDYLRVSEPGDVGLALATLRDDEGNALALHKAEITVKNDELTVNLLWQAVSLLGQDYTAFIHIVDDAGNLVAQNDSPPLNGFFPTSFWRVDWPVAESVTFTLSPGVYTVYTGLYLPRTGDRLAVHEDERTVGNVVLVGEVQVEMKSED